MRVVAPYFMLVEVTNAIYKKALRQLISMEEAAHLTANLPDLGIQLRQPHSSYTCEQSAWQRNFKKTRSMTLTTWLWPSCSIAIFGPPTSGSTKRRSTTFPESTLSGRFNPDATRLEENSKCF